MLKEFKDLRQYPGEKPRKCFSDDYFDLFVWYETDGNIMAFQLCYGLQINEHMLEWHDSKGFKHNRVDDGEGFGAGPKRTPIVLPDGAFPYKKVIDLFLDRIDKRDKTILPDLLFIYDKIIEHQ